VLDFADTNTRKPVFRGSGTPIVSGPESNAAKIHEAIRRIVAGVPHQQPAERLPIRIRSAVPAENPAMAPRSRKAGRRRHSA
jgi:hypothetical protein